MKLKLKKVNNHIYIVDVDAKPQTGDNYEFDGNIFFAKIGDKHGDRCFKVIATLDQIDIDQLFEKWLKAVAEKEAFTFIDKHTYASSFNPEHTSFIKGYLQAKKENCWNNSDLEQAWSEGYHRKVDEIKENKLRYIDSFIQQLKTSKIPECEVELEMEEIPTGSFTQKKILYMYQNSQTAIEQLSNLLPQIDFKNDPYYKDIFQKAKEIEKQQIIDAYWGGINGYINTVDKIGNGAEQYYNEIFKKL